MLDANPYEPPGRDAAGPTIAGPGPFTVLDWIGAIVTVLAALAMGLLSLRTRALGAMLDDMGVRALPLLTRLALRPWFGLSLSAPSLIMVGLAVWRHQRLSLGGRRALVVAGFLLAVGGFVLILAGLYLPISDLAGAIQSQ